MTIYKKIACLALVITALGGMLYGCAAASGQTFLPTTDNSDTGQLNPSSRVAAQQVNRLPTLTQPTATPDSRLSQPCLVGIWEAQDLEQIMADSYASTPSTLKLEAVEGEMLYEFTADGWLTIRFNHFAARFSGEVDGLPISAYQLLDGSATAQYQIDDIRDELVLTEFGGEGISAALDINQQRLAEGDLPAWRAFTSGLSDGANVQPTPLVAYARLAGQCFDGLVILQMVEPKNGPQIELIKR